MSLSPNKMEIMGVELIDPGTCEFYRVFQTGPLIHPNSSGDASNIQWVSVESHGFMD